MASSTDFTVKILGDASNAKKVVDQFGDGLGKSASGWGGMFKNAASTAGGVLGALGIANVTQQVMDFGQQSVDAFKEAEQSQALLEQAYKKFPAVADVNINKLRELNTALQSKTGYDDDAIAASQASLAQFGLTGDQIQKLTPLMLDYAAKTGKDLPSAADALGKAVLGQGRGLKAIGVNFKDTGDAAGNFDQLMGALGDKVGGTAEAMGETGAGKAKILEATFGDLQETIGEKLLPIITNLQSFLITDLIPAFAGVIGWVSENSWVFGVIGGVIAAVLVPAFIAWAAGIWATTVALLANPITWIILAIIALIAIIILLVANWDAVVAWITQAWGTFINWIVAGLAAFGAWWNSFWAAIGAFVSNAWTTWIVNPIRSAVDWISTAIAIGMQAVSTAWNNTWTGLGGVVKGIWNGILSFIEGGINGVIDLINNMIRGVNSITGAVGIPAIGLIGRVSFPRLATGTVTDGPMFAMIGDNPGGREVVAPFDSYIDELRHAAGVGRTAASAPGAASPGPVDLSDRTLDALAGKVATLITMGANKQIRTALGR